MERKELDEKILAAITTLNSEGKSLTVINIEQITGLLKYQIYSSKYKNQLEIRGRKARAIHKVREIQRETEALSVAKDSDESQAVIVRGQKRLLTLISHTTFRVSSRNRYEGSNCRRHRCSH